MSYSEMAQLDILNVVRNIKTDADYEEFRNLIAHYFAEKAQKAIDAMWDNGEINEKTIEEWGSTKMRTNKGNYTKKVGILAQQVWEQKNLTSEQFENEEFHYRTP